jgi:hypothetical protein
MPNKPLRWITSDFRHSRVRRNHQRLPSCLLFENDSASTARLRPGLISSSHFRSRLATNRLKLIGCGAELDLTNKVKNVGSSRRRLIQKRLMGDVM